MPRSLSLTSSALSLARSGESASNSPKPGPKPLAARLSSVAPPSPEASLLRSSFSESLLSLGGSCSALPWLAPVAPGAGACAPPHAIRHTLARSNEAPRFSEQRVGRQLMAEQAVSLSFSWYRPSAKTACWNDSGTAFSQANEEVEQGRQHERGAQKSDRPFGCRIPAARQSGRRPFHDETARRRCVSTGLASQQPFVAKKHAFSLYTRALGSATRRRFELNQLA